MPRLSVIVPFHNVQDFAQDALASLARNVRPDIEFLLVDDCSTDATPEILDRWRPRLPRCTVITHGHNMGIAAARNSGIDAAEGDYLTFLDGDDWYAPGHLPELLDAVQSLGCDFVRTDHVRTTGARREFRRAPAPVRGRVLDPRDVITPAEGETMVDYPFAWAGAYHRRLFADGAMRFATRLRTSEDRLWTWKLHLTAKSFAALDMYGVFYRRGVTTSLTQIKDARQLDFMAAHDELLADVRADRDAERFLPKVVRTYCALIAFHLANARTYEPAVARRLPGMARAALHGMPSGVLDDVLADMDRERAELLRRLRRGRAPVRLLSRGRGRTVRRPAATTRKAG